MAVKKPAKKTQAAKKFKGVRREKKGARGLAFDVANAQMPN
jgi:hypothetical protein